MKLYEIENYLKKKLRYRRHIKDHYIYFKNGYWVNHKGQTFYMSPEESEATEWEEYTEPDPPKVKRYWLWIIKSHYVYKTGQYVDADGRASNGEIYAGYWYKSEKIKSENEWVEIDDKGHIVDWSPR